MRNLSEDSQSRYISRLVRKYDRDLTAKRSGSGSIVVLRKAHRVELVSEIEDQKVYFVRDSRQFVFALTENWATTGRPRQWGGEVVLQRLRKHDCQANEALFSDLEKAEKDKEDSRKRNMKNKTEDWLSEKHSVFKESFKDVRTSNMNMNENKRRTYEKNQTLKGE